MLLGKTECPFLAVASLPIGREATASSINCNKGEVFTMFGFGIPELIIILVIVTMIFGVGRLPELGGALGKTIRNFRKAADGKDDIEITSKDA